MILWFVLLFVFTCAINCETIEQTHICHRIAQGELAKFELLSFTFLAENVLVLIVKDAEQKIPHKYYISTSFVHEAALNLPEKHDFYHDGELATTIDALNLNSQEESVKGIYLLNLKAGFVNIQQQNYFSKLFTDVLLFTDNRLRIWHKSQPSENKSLPTSFAYGLIHDARGKWGYLLRKDTSTPNSQTVVQNFNYDVNKFDSLFAGEESSYYLTTKQETEKMQFAIQLISAGTDEERRSFFPTGFILGDRLYLFDSALGCVYILNGWKRDTLAIPVVPVIKASKNVPFEKFFHCPTNFAMRADYPLKSERCNTIQASPSTSTSISKSTSTSQMITTAITFTSASSSSHTSPVPPESSNTLLWILFALAIILAVAMAAIIYLVKRQRRRKLKIRSNRNKSAAALKKKSGPNLKGRHQSKSTASTRNESKQASRSTGSISKPMFKNSPKDKLKGGPSTASIKTDASKKPKSKGKSKSTVPSPNSTASSSFSIKKTDRPSTSNSKTSRSNKK